MKFLVAVALFVSTLAAVLARPAAAAPEAEPGWNAQAAATYLDARLDWWLAWPNSARDHGTACVSCHTALPYALARPSLRQVLKESARPAAEERMLANVTKRVRLWRDVEPFYPDQTRGLPKSSESRGTEAVLNALILATRDSDAGTLSEDSRLAFASLWALQMRNGALKGAWAWLNFRLEPWEAPGSPYFGASLAAIALGTAPGDYAATPEIQTQVTLLREYLREGADTQSLFNRLMILWASAKLPGVLQEPQRQAILDAAIAAQGADGGWSMASLAPWQRIDGSVLDSASDGYATALVTLAMQQAAVPSTAVALQKARAWLVAKQNPVTGAWPASSVNKQRDPASEASKFMSDAATAYATLALTHGR